VRFRIDGILKNFDSFSSSIQQAVTTRIKIMAKLDISERRMPQDGRIKIKIAGRNIDLRVSCLPTMYGESMVLRLLDRESISFSLESLGFPDKEKAQFETLINQPYGIILVTGPTGSGKTTTLYSALNTIHSPEKKIITIEDPVEYELDGINQVHVNAKAGLTFAKGLRSIVRQDPDVVLVGEIRDAETAEIAIHAALTGHLVFSTLHTNDSAGAITRLIEMGVEDYLLSSSLIGVLAQRLVRILCPHCKTPFEPDRSLLERFRLSEEALARASFYKPVGCDACAHTGYKGRTALFELLSINDDIRELILKNKSSASIRDMGMRHGMTLLQSDGWWKALNGVTSIEEVIRTTGMA
jgi:type II secretory ATPase GspE/PulE/Tfp pilus assembly ATPase PilB-like protein